MLLALATSMTLAVGEEPRADSTSYPQVEITTSLGVIIAELYPDAAPRTVEIFLGLAQGTRQWRDPVENEMVERPYYDGTTFHRVIPDFMIQGGDILGTGSGGAGFTFADEMNAEGLGLHQQFVFQDGQLHPEVGYMQQQIMASVIRPRLEAKGFGPDSPQNEVQQAFAAILGELEGTLTLKDFYEALGYSYDDQLAPREPLKGTLALANRGPDTNSGQFYVNLRDTHHLRGKHTVFGHVISGFSVVEAIAEVATDEQGKPLEPVHIISIRPLGDSETSED